MNKVLALDTVTEGCSVALWTGERMIGRFEEPGRGHALRVLPMVDEVLEEGRLRLEDLDALVAVVGPGAFTGVRLCVSVAQGLAYGAGLRIVPVTSLEALAFGAMQSTPAPRRVLACLDARMGELYWGVFVSDQARGVRSDGVLRLSSPEQLAAAVSPVDVAVGRGIGVLQAQGRWQGPADPIVLPRAEHSARLGLLRLAAGEAVDPAGLEPVYLRDKVALTEAERAAARMSLNCHSSRM